VAVAITEERSARMPVGTVDLETLLASEPVTACSSYPDLVTPREAARLRLSKVVAQLKSGTCSTRRLGDSPNVEGLIAWSPLEWDSEQFGFPAGRIDLLLASGDYHAATRIKSQLLAEALEECRESGIRHVTARANAAEFSSIHAFERTGFQTIDQILTFGIRLDHARERNPGDCVELFKPEHLEGILAIARTAYRFDRFHADPSLPGGAADRLHETWMRNSCLHGGADAVFVATIEGRVASYVTVKMDGLLATIVLVATAEWARGKGMARAATFGALEWCRKQGVAAVQVGTQLRNVAASRLYEDCGFRFIGGSLTLRKLLGGGQRS
jgi:dTDP-4-amino-4,6-dideoxy-D-galactose acyltransferase